MTTLISVTTYKGQKILVYQDERGAFFTQLNDRKNATIYYFNTELKALENRKADIDLTSGDSPSESERIRL